MSCTMENPVIATITVSNSRPHTGGVSAEFSPLDLDVTVRFSDESAPVEGQVITVTADYDRGERMLYGDVHTGCTGFLAGWIGTLADDERRQVISCLRDEGESTVRIMRVMPWVEVLPPLDSPPAPDGLLGFDPSQIQVGVAPDGSPVSMADEIAAAAAAASTVEP